MKTSVSALSALSLFHFSSKTLETALEWGGNCFVCGKKRHLLSRRLSIIKEEPFHLFFLRLVAGAYVAFASGAGCLVAAHLQVENVLSTDFNGITHDELQCRRRPTTFTSELQLSVVKLVASTQLPPLCVCTLSCTVRSERPLHLGSRCSS